MKTCPTCGMNADDRASFCPCCGTSFVVRQPDPTPEPAAAPVTPTVKPTPPPPVFTEKKEKRSHPLAIVLITVLATLSVGLGALWATGGLAAILNKDAPTDTSAADEQDKPTISLNAWPDIAVTYGDGQEITTGQYLAYLYLEFENLYYNQGLYQYEMYGLDPWEQQFPYGESGEKLYLSDYIIRATQDNIKRQIVLQQMMQEYGIKWIAEDEAEINQQLKSMEKDAYIDLGFNNESYGYVMKQTNLNERSTFYGLYKVGGARAISELELRQHFAQNYLSYHALSIAMTDSTGKVLASDSLAYQWFVERMAVYQTVCEQQGFEAAYELYEKDQPTIQSLKSGNINVSLHTTVTLPTTGATAPSTNSKHDHQLRQDEDATSMDENWAQAVRTVNVGDATIVEYKAGGTTPTIALIQRLDIYSDASVYENAVENIIYTLRYEAFDQEVKETMAMLPITFDAKVIDAAKPEEFLNILTYSD